MVFLQSHLRVYSPIDVTRIVDDTIPVLSQRFGWSDFSITENVGDSRYGCKGEARAKANDVESGLYIICLHPQKGTGSGGSSLEQKTNLRPHPEIAHEWIIAVLPRLFVFRYSSDFHDGKVPEVLHYEVQPSCWSVYKTKEELLSGTNPVGKKRDCHALYNPTPWSQVFLIRQAPVSRSLSQLDTRLFEMTRKEQSDKDRYITV
ncbi:MAG: hypothetical protein Q7K43_02455 [Candidatus Woesearchaeota archaeon]|nr:hypothetical protein [Candidatus Woesearchaeota archaeon]